MSVLIQRLKRPIVRVLAAFTGPRIVYGWRNADGSWCAHTRVSTHTCFEGLEGLTLGDHVFIGHFNRVDGSNGLLIEEGVQLTNFSSILSHSSHRSVRVMGRRYVTDPNPAGYIRKATRVGAYSFIGPHSVIAPGAQIGKGVIVQGYSFVSGVVPDFAIVGPQAHGKPAVVVGDTREIDRPLLLRHPELQAIYAQWAGKDTVRRMLQGHQANQAEEMAEGDAPAVGGGKASCAASGGTTGAASGAAGSASPGDAASGTRNGDALGGAAYGERGQA